MIIVKKMCLSPVVPFNLVLDLPQVNFGRRKKAWRLSRLFLPVDLVNEIDLRQV